MNTISDPAEENGTSNASIQDMRRSCDRFSERQRSVGRGAWNERAVGVDPIVPFEAVCVGSRDFNGFCGDGSVDALAAVRAQARLRGVTRGRPGLPGAASASRAQTCHTALTHPPSRLKALPRVQENELHPNRIDPPADPSKNPPGW